ncbi:hypothetical protein HF923_07565 [Acidithiobacillus ferriphilus]|uniref:hypothetical protein n=1 Tax=Acidithiobacillus ferriphilus TaxID=1689834 RepID=UPI001C07B9FB|nr:hypothetical protein [Acidithiobacillus ferriphilus]MBU2845679.1 hypothetical protein [Acidithiobacillus ferriphilus]
MITENGTGLSTTQFYKRIKAILKEDPALDGSGHLYLHPAQTKPLDDLVIVSIQSHTLEVLRAQGIVGFDEEKTRDFISVVLRYIGLPHRGGRAPGTPRLNKKPKNKSKQKTKAKAKPQPQKPQPKQKRRHEEVRVIQVTVKKARTFHYPRDLTTPGGDS